MRIGWMMRLALLLMSLLCSGSVLAAPPVSLTSGLKVTGGTTIKPGTYRLSDTESGILQVSGSDFTVDMRGVKIVGPGTGKGIGIHITDARNVTIKGADVSGCLWGIVIERSIGVKLLDCRTSRNNNLKPGSVIDESGREPEDQWGGGILLRDSRDCLAQRCVSQYQWDGVDVVRSDHNTIEDGDYSYNGNWGIHLWNSSRNIFRRNRAIWCTTGGGTLFQALTGWQTYDSQAVGIDHNSNENLIEGNDLRFGGDAIFIRANEGGIAPGAPVPPRNSSDRNILRYNDCSFSPNNAIEVDFVEGTIIEGNNCSFSNYGMWLGYARNCVVKNNICLNDSNHAVEIENGQGDRFERNVFGFDTPRPGTALVYLRQNGRDRTPSAGYVFKENLFYGTEANRAVLLKDTQAELGGNVALNADFSGGEVFGKEYGLPQGKQTNPAVGNSLFQLGSDNDPSLYPVISIRPGSLVTLNGQKLHGASPTIVEVEGIPVQVKSEAFDKVTFRMPEDLWDRPQKETVTLRVFNGRQWSKPMSARLSWPGNLPRITEVSPNPAKIGDTITLTGANLSGGRVLLNNQPAKILESTPTRLTLQLPEGILVPTRYNLLWERGEEENRVHTAPLTFGVQVPQEQMPHLLSVTFEPKTLRVGELLKVTMTLRNNLPTPALLTRQPAPPFTYEEKQASYEMGLNEVPGRLHLRVTSDNTGPHHPGSWPYLFGFPKDHLAPGETITVTGYLKMDYAGQREFRVGLVAGGFRFIDDNAFRTKITVLGIQR